MKIHNLVLLFLIIFLSVICSYNVKQKTLEKIADQKRRYDAIIEAAVDDAAECLVETDRGKQPSINKEEGLKVFFQSLYSGFGILHDPEAQEELHKYIPVILVTDRDGCYVWYHGGYGENKIAERWSEKYPYAGYYQSEKNTAKGYYINFTIDDTISGMDNQNYLPWKSERKDILKVYPEMDFLEEDMHFEELRRSAIIDTVTRNMNYYIQEYNRIGNQYGISYKFSVPYLDDSQWARTINDISILVIMQGYRYGNFTTETYNRVEVGGSRTRKSDKYYITETGGNKTYHKSFCENCSADLVPYDTKRDCAALGAYPCRLCNP